jgi:hypothetical protein
MTLQVSEFMSEHQFKHLTPGWTPHIMTPTHPQNRSPAVSHLCPDQVEKTINLSGSAAKDEAMGHQSQEHQDQLTNPQLTPSQDIESQAPVHQQGAASEALQRAQGASSAPLRPSDVLALQRTVGNRAVQRLVESPGGSVQRHVDEEMTSWAGRVKGQMNALLATRRGNRASEDSAVDSLQSDTGALGNTLIRNHNAETQNLNAAAGAFHEKFP